MQNPRQGCKCKLRANTEGVKTFTYDKTVALSKSYGNHQKENLPPMNLSIYDIHDGIFYTETQKDRVFFH